MANVAVGIYLFSSGPSPAFALFLVVAIIGVLMYEVLHLFYNVLPRLLKFCHKKGGRTIAALFICTMLWSYSCSLSFSLSLPSPSLSHTHACTEQEQSLLSINEKYADTNNDGRKSPLGELKAVLVRQNCYLSLWCIDFLSLSLSPPIPLSTPSHSLQAYSYRHHFGTLALVLIVIVPINIAVCVFIALAWIISTATICSSKQNLTKNQHISVIHYIQSGFTTVVSFGK